MVKSGPVGTLTMTIEEAYSIREHSGYRFPMEVRSNQRVWMSWNKEEYRTDQMGVDRIFDTLGHIMQYVIDNDIRYQKV